MPAASPSEIARFLIEELKPALGKSMRAMSEDEIGDAIVKAVAARFPGWQPDDLGQALLLAQEIERADLAFDRAGGPA